MQIRRFVGAAAVALTLITVGCNQSQEGGETTPPAETQQTETQEGMETQGETPAGTDAAAAPVDDGHGHGADDGHGH